MKVDPQQEHRWLHKLIGEWEYQSEAFMGPDQPPIKSSGQEAVQTLGDVWVLCQGKGEMPGGELGRTQMTLGFDPVRKKFVGTFIGSMMTHLWVYEGELDPTGKVLTLETEGPSFVTEGKMAKYRDVITLESDDRRLLTATVLTDEGHWHPFMKATYRRCSN